jgi:hypothetical protein
MLEWLKKALVQTFVGAIALGWVFAQGVCTLRMRSVGRLRTGLRDESITA